MSTLIFPSEDTVQQFAKGITEKNVRHLKLLIADEKIVVAKSVPPTSSVIDDYAKIQGYFTDFEACFVLFHFDLEETSSWALLRFVSERAKIREKMLYSSSTENVFTGLGKMNFAYTLYGVEKDQMSLSTFVEQNIGALSPALKTTLAVYVDAITSSNLADEKEREVARREKLEHASALSREEQQLREEARMETVASGASSISFPIDAGVGPVLTEFANKQVSFVELSIVNETLTVTKLLRTHVASEISTTIDRALPHFYLLTFQHGGPESTLFIYSCPTGCPVRPRMQYSMGKNPTLDLIKNAGITLTKTIESQEADKDLTLDQITDILSTLAGHSIDEPNASSPNGAAIEIKNTRGANTRPSQRTFARTPHAAAPAPNASLLTGLKMGVKVNVGGQ